MMFFWWSATSGWGARMGLGEVGRTLTVPPLYPPLFLSSDHVAIKTKCQKKQTDRPTNRRTYHREDTLQIMNNFKCNERVHDMDG